MGAIPRDNLEITAYYLTCEGENPFQADLDDASLFIGLADAAVNALSLTVCFGNAALLEAQGTINSIESAINSIEGIAQCEPTKEQVGSVIYEGFCQKSFRGVYQIWLGQYLSAAFVLALILAASLAYCPCCNAPPPPRPRSVAPEDRDLEDPAEVWCEHSGERKE